MVAVVSAVFSAVVSALRIVASLFAMRGYTHFGLVAGGVLAPTWQDQHHKHGNRQNQTLHTNSLLVLLIDLYSSDLQDKPWSLLKVSR
jgi:hypothetical protein